MDTLIHHLLRNSTERSPEKEALVHRSERLTYGELWRRVSALAEGLRRGGLRRGDRVAIYLDPSITQVVAIFGVSLAGGVFVPINSVLLAEQVKHIASDCAATGLITTSAKLSSLGATLADIPSLKFIVTAGNAEEPSVHLPILRLEDLDRLGASQCPSESCISKDLGAILYTSGSTGKPKGVMLSHANVIAGATIVSTYLEITERERILAVLPFSFDAGLNQLTTSVQRGGTIVLMTFTFAREIVRMLREERITGLAGVPTLWSLLSQPSSGLMNDSLPDLRYITNTGGAMPQPVLAVLRRALPTTRVFLMYGLTEAFRSTYLPPEELDRRPTSMGRAIPDTEILVVTDEGRLAKPGEIGELIHRGPTVSMGYWGRPEDTARSLRPNPLLPPELGDCERVCYSGDLVTTDEDGFLYFVGRRDTMIKSSGFRVSPTEIEEVIFKSGLVQAAAVIGVPDDVLGQAIKAFVVPTNGGETPDSEQLLSFCFERLPRYMWPKTVEFLDVLPKTSSGKVDYPALRRREGL